MEILRQVWVHQYYWDPEGHVRWREGTALPPASLRFDSPFDTEANYCVKRGVDWSGYRVHVTESCDQDLPHLVVHVTTTIAPVQDGQLTEQIHDDLAARCLAPAEHIVDITHLSPAHIERAQRVHGITLLGPVLADNSRQAKAGSGFAKAAFTIDWVNEQAAICPRGAMSVSWTTLNISDHIYFQARFAEADCRPCPDRALCTSSTTGSRSVAVLPQLLHEIQMRNRLDQQTEQWQRRFAIRAGHRVAVGACARERLTEALTALEVNFTADGLAEIERRRRPGAATDTRPRSCQTSALATESAHPSTPRRGQ
ncbi:transposase [Streptomyces sp. NPDC057199]|uniref:transposase n=1 Tax=Streptomyces sp. NPDC057199 TaxID=3346047 RepID=UPI003639793C